MSNVTSAVEAANQPSAELTPAAQIRRAIDVQTEAFHAVLPSDVDPQRFSRLVLSAVKATPELMQCFTSDAGKTSLLLAAMQAASLGLEPNTPTQECWILPRKNKSVHEAELQVGYRGFLKLARRSGTITTVFAEVVRERDEFHFHRGLDCDDFRHIAHEPRDEAGDLVKVYAVARFTNGGYAVSVLDRIEVEARRNLSPGWRSEAARKYSPWMVWPAEMWRKTALRALMPYLELSPEAHALAASDGATFSLDADEGAIVPDPFDPEAA